MLSNNVLKVKDSTISIAFKIKIMLQTMSKTSDPDFIRFSGCN